MIFEKHYFTERMSPIRTHSIFYSFITSENFKPEVYYKTNRKNKVFDYKSLIYETELKVSIMFKRDKHLQTECVLTPLCFITQGVGEGKGLVTDR